LKPHTYFKIATLFLIENPLIVSANSMDVWLEFITMCDQVNGFLCDSALTVNSKMCMAQWEAIMNMFLQQLLFDFSSRSHSSRLLSIPFDDDDDDADAKAA
jgi:hypothetical protein